MMSLVWTQIPLVEISSDAEASRILELSKRDVALLRDAGVFERESWSVEVRVQPAPAHDGFLDVPLLRHWSISALLVEQESIFAGLVDRNAHVTRSGGLLRYHRPSRRVTVYSVPDAIHSLARVGPRIFIGTSRGTYVLKDGAFTRVVWKRADA